MRVLAVEDNRQLLALLRSHLVKQGFAVDGAETLADGLALASAGEHDVILLDLALPDGDGAQLIAALRGTEKPVPIIVVTARSAIHDRVDLLDSGADDYVVKPFDLDELVARIRAVARRRGVPRDERLAFADLVFDRDTRQAVVAGRAISLRPREAALLEALLRRAGEPVQRDALLAGLYSFDEEIGSNALDVHVHHLRRRLAEAGARVGIETVRGVGYALKAEA